MKARVRTLLGRLRIGRFRDWYRWTWIRLRANGTIVAAAIPQIDPPFAVRMSPGATLVLGRNVRFRPGFSADIEGSGVLEIGPDTAFNVNCWIGVTTRVTIEGTSLFGPLVTITDGNHRYDDPTVPIWQQGLDTREITIGRNVWIGAKATIINNVGDGAVIGANAVVTRPVPARSVAVGIPARVRHTIGVEDPSSSRAEGERSSG